MQPILSIIVPVLNEEGNIEVLLQALSTELKKLDLPYEVILVDDGSDDGTWDVITAASIRDHHIRGISLSRNFGPQNAIFAGLHFACGNAIVTMDGDLQHPPEKIGELVQAWRNGNKIVETKRLDSDDFSFMKRFTSRVFYRLFSFLSGIEVAAGTSDFRLLDRQAVMAIIAMQDADLFLKGMTHWVGYPHATVVYRAAERRSGSTKWSWFRLVRYSIGSLASFSLKPLRLGIWLGFVTSFLAFLELLYIFYRYFQGIDVPGWASTLTVISFMFGILFILIGILGMYLGGAVEMLKKRPRFLVQDRTGFDDEC